jgi:uncharacterized OsmC-like protein
MANLLLTSEAKSLGGLKVEVSAGANRWTIDGNAEAGATPVQALLGSLAGCLGVIAQAFAPAHEVVVDAVRVRVEGDFDPDGYTGKAPVRTGFSAIRYQVEIESASPREKVEALRAHIVKVCPIKDTLTGVPVTAKS